MSGSKTELGPVSFEVCGHLDQWAVKEKVKHVSFRVTCPGRTRPSPWRRWRSEGQEDVSDQRFTAPEAVNPEHMTEAPAPCCPQLPG